MCKKYDTVYSCGHYKTRYVVCAKGKADEMTDCGNLSLDNAKSTKNKCKWKGCDKKAGLKRPGPDGKPEDVSSLKRICRTSLIRQEYEKATKEE
jgi:hypothetical protein